MTLSFWATCRNLFKPGLNVRVLTSDIFLPNDSRVDIFDGVSRPTPPIGMTEQTCYTHALDRRACARLKNPANITIYSGEGWNRKRTTAWISMIDPGHTPIERPLVASISQRALSKPKLIARGSAAKSSSPFVSCLATPFSPQTPNFDFLSSESRTNISTCVLFCFLKPSCTRMGNTHTHTPKTGTRFSRA